MLNFPRHHVSRMVVGFGAIALTQLGLMLPSVGQYQGQAGDIVVIGDSPSDWTRFRSYWQNLLQISNPDPTPQSESDADVSQNAKASDPKALEAAIKKNLVVAGLKLQPILKLNGSSQVLGQLTNRNQQAVTVSAVNFEVVDGQGTLVRSGSAAPQPSSLAPGQTVTFAADLLGIVPEDSYKVRLTPSPFVIQGGF